MDITNFMTWFVSQVVDIFSWFFGILDSITFAGTSMLKVLITVVILVPLVGVFLTLTKNATVVGQKSERVKTNDIKDKKYASATTDVRR